MRVAQIFILNIANRTKNNNNLLLLSLDQFK